MVVELKNNEIEVVGGGVTNSNGGATGTITCNCNDSYMSLAGQVIAFSAVAVQFVSYFFNVSRSRRVSPGNAAGGGNTCFKVAIITAALLSGALAAFVGNRLN